MLKRLIRLLTGVAEAPRTFDPEFYATLYSDLNGEAPLQHWRRLGMREGRIGSLPKNLPAFDPDYYLSRYADVGQSEIKPFHHWLRFGRPEGRIAALSEDADGKVPQSRELIRQKNLFNQEFYLANYREDIPEASDPFDYYIAIGQHKGHKPTKDFDPLLYLLRYPQARIEGALLHYLERLRNGEAPIEDLSTLNAFPEVRTPEVWLNSGVQPQDLKDRDRQEGIAQSELFGQEQVLEFSIDDRTYRLVAPSADDFFNRLRDDRPCALSRLPHGFWDGLLELKEARQKIAEKVQSQSPHPHFSDDELDRLAERACDTVSPVMGIFNENFLREMFAEITANETGEDHLRSVSFKWQPTVENRVFGRTDSIGDMELEQLRFFARYFKPEIPIIEAMIWKRWVYSGDVMRMPAEARERPVVLVGAKRMAELGVRWKLPSFSHLEIPLSSYDQRYKILDQCKRAVVEAKALAAENGTKSPLIMLQGGSFAYWLIARLHKWDPSVFYLDFGQSLHIWFLDNPEIWMPWLLFHPRLIMENCKLDEFYQGLGIELPEPFARPGSTEGDL